MVNLTKNGYGFGFDAWSQVLLTRGSWGKNVIIFGADMSSSVHVDAKYHTIRKKIRVEFAL